MPHFSKEKKKLNFRKAIYSQCYLLTIKIFPQNSKKIENCFSFLNFLPSTVNYCAASFKICINGCGCLCLWETWLRNLNFVVRPKEVWVRSSAWAFFPSYFFYYFYQFSIRSWDVEVHTKFRHHNIFFVREIQCFLILKKTFQNFFS
jgi:hypothetical protein